MQKGSAGSGFRNAAGWNRRGKLLRRFRPVPECVQVPNLWPGMRKTRGSFSVRSDSGGMIREGGVRVCCFPHPATLIWGGKPSAASTWSMCMNAVESVSVGCRVL